MLAVWTILLICTLLALALVAPFVYLRRRRRRRRGVAQVGLLNSPVTFKQALPGLLFVAVMFVLLAQEHIAPTSWLGSRLAATNGHTLFFLFYAVVGFAIAHLIRALINRKQRKNRTP